MNAIATMPAFPLAPLAPERTTRSVVAVEPDVRTPGSTWAEIRAELAALRGEPSEPPEPAEHRRPTN